MNEILKFIFGHCSSADPRLSELGSSVFATLTDVAPDQFVPHIESICEMFSATMVATEASGNMVTPVVYNILLGMTYLVPFIFGHIKAGIGKQNQRAGTEIYPVKLCGCKK